MKRLTAPAAEAPSLDPERLFAGLAGARGLALAVSGGADSTALMILMARWSARPPCVVICVDHGLRPESAGEARLVAANAARLGLPARVVQAPERVGGGNLQDWARRARYACLARAALDSGLDAIVTAHHQDDQAETFLMRVARGSGVYGLAAMAEEGRAEGLRLVRPLLDVPRAALAEIVRASGLQVAHDPGNADESFERVRMRGLLPDLARHGLTAERLAGTARRLGRAAAALDHYSDVLLAEHFRADEFGRVAGAADPLAAVPEEVGLRALSRILTAVGGADYPPSMERTEALWTAILTHPDERTLRRSLHGVVITIQQGVFAAVREWGRKGIASIPAAPGSTVNWDGRFSVAVPPGAALEIGALGESGRRLGSELVGYAARKTLPGLFQDGTLIAAPDGVSALDGGEPLARLRTDCLVGPRLGLATTPLVTVGPLITMGDPNCENHAGRSSLASTARQPI